MANSPQGLETVEITAHPTDSGNQGFPIVGEETQALLENLNLPDEESRKRLLDEAVAVMKQCVPPMSPAGSKTGLVIGYVQSGKTMSFTTVTALACDNGYRMVIVIGGTKTNLFNQSNKRLKRDLRLGDDQPRQDRKWKYFENPRVKQRQNIESALATWKDSSVPEDERQVALLTVMKQTNHLQQLKVLLADMDLEGVPVLIIDDEADQAGLNNRVNQGLMSTIYRHLTELRRLHPHHSYLQYTATPQAPLLINLADVLSPDFAEVLTPGSGYTGGKEFFINNPQLIQTIPFDEIPTEGNPLIDPPATLLEAMMLFYLGVASGYIRDKIRGNRSMMIHPSQKTDPHGDYFHWVRRVNNQWKKTFNLDTNDSNRQELLTFVKRIYEDLVKTVRDLPSFEKLVETLPRAINQTNIEQINATGGKTPQIEWKNEYAHILVGGQAMDRGFTVEGLTVTYMPRAAGMGNADTIQQRARFFGYKHSYLGYCRVFLESDVQDAFKSYVEHEESIRKQLSKQRGKPLSEWKRAFLLDLSLRPARANVLSMPYMRGEFSDEWYAPDYPNDSDDAIKTNQEVVDTFWSKLPALDEKIFGKLPVKKHLFASNIPLQEVLEELIIRFRTTHLSDSQQLTGLMLQVQRYLEDNREEICDIYLIDKGKERRRTLFIKNKGKLSLFQGRSTSNEPEKYPGDRKIRVDDKLTVQIHTLNLHVEAEGREIPNVPVIAIWVPTKMARGWVSQDQGGVL